MSNMNGLTRKKLYHLITSRDGEYCRSCGALPKERQLVIDHRDNYNSNNDPYNLQLLCRKCNYLKNPRRPLDSVSECVNEDETEFQKGRRTEPLFIKFVMHELNELKEEFESELINSGAEEIGISPVTAKRYLNKLCSSRGILQRIPRVKGNVIRYKDEIETQDFR